MTGGSANGIGITADCTCPGVPRERMRILFGPAHDGLHISPDTPGAYEWWYFDALSDDGRFALVAIFFLGTPMSPYYKAVVDGKKPLPKDWCGVFFSLHEHVDGPAVTATGDKQRDEWLERAYAYNIYRGGSFADDGSKIAVGGSCVQRDDEDGTTWELSLHEPGLWWGKSAATARFTTRTRLTEPDSGHENEHSWVCVAPVCHVQFDGQSGGRTISFSGNGYHDHNFGMLPWADTDIWYWGWARLVGRSGEPRHVVYYADIASPESEATSVLLFDHQGRLQDFSAARTLVKPPNLLRRNVYGLRYAPVFAVENCHDKTRTINNSLFPGAFSGGPFYQRSPIEVHVVTKEAYDNGGKDFERGWGIGEVFRPARLCGPIASRAVWTRMRRRS